MFLFRLTKIFLAFYEENDEKFPTMPTFAYTYLYLLHKKHFFCMLRVANQIVLSQVRFLATSMYKFRFTHLHASCGLRNRSLSSAK